MSKQTTKANNRALTLKGVNKLFSVVGVEIERTTLGIYQASHRGLTYQDRTLEGIGQQLLVALQAEHPDPHISKLTMESYPIPAQALPT